MATGFSSREHSRAAGLQGGGLQTRPELWILTDFFYALTQRRDRWLLGSLEGSSGPQGRMWWRHESIIIYAEMRDPFTERSRVKRNHPKL